MSSKMQQICVALALCLALAGTTWADGGVTFTDIAENDGAGIDYRRTDSPRKVGFEDLLLEPSPIPSSIFFDQSFRRLPMKWDGAPGVVIFDYDRDGDLDLYATNGPGTPNSLYSSQLVETGQLTFVDVAAGAGVEATSQDSSGVCFGDIDNDGDHDLYVLGTGEPSQLFENLGNGIFSDISAASGAAGGNHHSTGCSMADFDGDGLLDIVVGNTFDGWEHRKPHRPGPHYEFFEHTELFINTGGNAFVDQSAASGLENVSNMAGPGLTGAAYTWALATADVDLDGDVDILFADNQASGAPSSPSEERGWLRLYLNDGSAVFTEVTQAAGLDEWGGWMGLDFGDLNCDGHLDFFATDLGYVAGKPSKWFFGQSDGSFSSPGVGNLIMTPFGWGTSIFDYDNDGDSDIVYHGGMHTRSFMIADNPGVLLQNVGDCSGEFAWDDGALTKDHRTRLVQGVAVGDLDQDGFEDIVSVADTDLIPRRFFPGVGPPFFIWGPVTGSPFDAFATFEAVYVPFPPGNWTLLEPYFDQPDGTLSVEISSADNGNGWVEVTALGSAGILQGGTMNRDGIGAVVYFTPEGGKASIRPVIGGSSYASQDALPANFGLGAAASGTAEVLWSGGVRNKLYDLASGERVVMPHIPCSYDADWKNFGQYNSCVMQALNGYKQAGLITAAERNRLRDSARRAFDETK